MIFFKTALLGLFVSFSLFTEPQFGQKPNSSVHLNFKVVLEGPYQMEQRKMSNALYANGYLPGMKPRTFFGIAEKPGQPFNKKPWNYEGREGLNKSTDLYSKATVDWILVELHSEDGLSINKFAGLLQSDGTVLFEKEMDIDHVDKSKRYFVKIYHRNHLPVASREAIGFIDNSLNIDFTTLADLSQKRMDDGIFVMIAGNGFIDGEIEGTERIDESDLSSWSKENNQNSSYLQNDFDLNGDVNVRDQKILLDNLRRKIN